VRPILITVGLALPSKNGHCASPDKEILQNFFFFFFLAEIALAVKKNFLLLLSEKNWEKNDFRFQQGCQMKISL
jgi:hypothetical protein